MSLMVSYYQTQMCQETWPIDSTWNTNPYFDLCYRLLVSWLAMLQNLYFVILKLNASISAGLSNLTSLSLKRSNAVTAEGMRAFANLVNLLSLDLEGCLKIHGGLIHLKGLLWSSWTFTTSGVVWLEISVATSFYFSRSDKARVIEYEILQLYCGFRYQIFNR